MLSTCEGGATPPAGRPRPKDATDSPVTGREHASEADSARVGRSGPPHPDSVGGRRGGQTDAASSPGPVERPWNPALMVLIGHVPRVLALLAGVGDRASAVGVAHGTRQTRAVAQLALWLGGCRAHPLVHGGLGLGRGFVRSQADHGFFQCHQREATGGPPETAGHCSHTDSRSVLWRHDAVRNLTVRETCGLPLTSSQWAEVYHALLTWKGRKEEPVADSRRSDVTRGV